MDSDEPSLVPQWLKGGSSSSSGIFSSASSNGTGGSSTALRDLNISTKRNIPDWEDRHFSDRNFRPNRHSDLGKPDDKSWKPPSIAKQPLNGRTTANHEDRQNNGAYDSRKARGFVSRTREEARNGYTEPGSRTHAASDAGTFGAKVAFDRNFPSLGEPRRNGYTPSVAPYKQGFLASKGSGNWTSKLADSPSPSAAIPDDNLASSIHNNAPNSPPAAAPAPAPAPTPAPTPKMSEALQQTLTTRATSADRQRLDQLAAKQSRQLIPVIAAGPKARTTAKSLAPLRPDAKPSARAASDHHPVRKTMVPGPVDRASTLLRTNSAGAGTPTTAVQPAAPSGMVALKPAGSGKLTERTSFFDSLRRKPSLSEQQHAGPEQQLPDAAQLASATASPAEDVGGASKVQHGATAKPAAAVVDSSSGSDCGTHDDDCSMQHDLVAAQEVDSCSDLHNNGSSSARWGVPQKLRALEEAEEEAFLRSLGWEEPEEGEEEGLTEEEIAAFLAASQARPKANARPLQIPSKAAQKDRSFMPSSYNSQTSVSDSESECD